MSYVGLELIEKNWQLITLSLLVCAILIVLFVVFIVETFFWLYDTIKSKILKRAYVIPYSHSNNIIIPLEITEFSNTVPNGFTWKTQIPFTTDQKKIHQALKKDSKNNIIAYDFREEK
jgi:hypothetical protein